MTLDRDSLKILALAVERLDAGFSELPDFSPSCPGSERMDAVLLALAEKLSSDWNQKFFFLACGGFCGRVTRDACNLGLARGYASVTGNGGHDSSLGFDGVWAANAPELQEDFGWRSNHVVTLIAKVITTHYYDEAIKYSCVAGTSAFEKKGEFWLPFVDSYRTLCFAPPPGMKNTPLAIQNSNLSKFPDRCQVPNRGSYSEALLNVA